MLLVSWGTLALLWPAAINGGPFWFPDTSNYVRAADAAVVYATGQRSEWSDRLAAGTNQPVMTNSAQESLPTSFGKVTPTRSVYAGRSIYYGFLLYLPMILVGSWGAIFLQSLITAGTLFYVGRILARVLYGKASPKLMWVLGGLTLVTPLPFYTSMLMPDIYSGLLILTMSVVIAFFDRLTRVERWVFVLASALFVTFHTTHLLIAAAVAAVGLLAAVFGRMQLRPLALAVPVLVIGAGSIAVFNLAVEMALNAKPLSPPFLSARLTAAGPGTDYLRRNCDADSEPFLLCRYLHRLPLESDSFLWSEDLQTGLFQNLSYEDQLTMASQDKTFFITTLSDDVLGFASVAVSSALEQLSSFDLENFNYPERRGKELFEKYPTRIAEGIAETRAAQRNMPIAPFVWLSVLSTLAALGVVAAIYLRSERAKTEKIPKELWYFVVLVVLGVLANALICGALSGPHARYQMRLIWIVPFASVVLLAAYRRPKSSAEGAKGGTRLEVAR
ncbi:hypothetical protein [Parafrankia sp. BMG5.11]|uniref:hypothetical protein n=1 Tax=Parafrankia sp. BMG5.11 TaxID=222540 RepID=UPI00103AC537|nr:hypothetical protein [Parafrankia sp. BMG5.11]TCJ32806.1 hypothetical protein E0504_41005 [Parafrankia sp. BMG5.11]